MKKLQSARTWQLVVIFILMAFVSATFLRLNNIGMIERRAAVIAADETGDSEVIQNRLYDLQRYVSSHMNTDMGKGVPLEQSYKRDAQKALTKATSDDNPNGNVYKKAQEVCAPQFSHYSYAYLQCTTSELAKYPAGNELISSIQLPATEPYIHVFSSPLWSPDWAGWSVAITLVILLMILTRLITLGVLKLLLSRQYKSI